MSKTAARFTLADIARATRAAKEQGAEAVEITKDGTIRIIIAGHCSGDAKRDAEEPKQHRDFKL